MRILLLLVILAAAAQADATERRALSRDVETTLELLDPSLGLAQAGLVALFAPEEIKWRRRGDGRYERVGKDSAEPTEPPRDQPDPRHRFAFDFYAWVPVSIEGSSTIAGQAAPLDLDFDDILDLYEFSGSTRFEAFFGRWSFYFDTLYVSMGTEATTPMAAVAVDIQQWVVKSGIGYRVVDRTDRAKHPWSIEAFLGARWNDIKQEISLTPGPSLGGSEQFLEIEVGGRLRVALSRDRRWAAVLIFHFAGFGIGSGSDLTVDFGLGVERRIGANKVLKLGWLFYDIDYEKGGGPQTFGMDMTLLGPYLAFGVLF